MTPADKSALLKTLSDAKEFADEMATTYGREADKEDANALIGHIKQAISIVDAEEAK